MQIIDNTTNYHQVVGNITTGNTTMNVSGCNVGNWNVNFNDTTKFVYNGNNTFTSTTFIDYSNEQLVKTEINDDSVVFIYKAMKNWSFNNETLWICFKDVYKVINNKLVKQERIFGKLEPAKTIEENYLFD